MPTAVYDILEQQKLNIRTIRSNIVGQIIFRIYMTLIIMVSMSLTPTEKATIFYIFCKNSHQS